MARLRGRLGHGHADQCGVADATEAPVTPAQDHDHIAVDGDDRRRPRVVAGADPLGFVGRDADDVAAHRTTHQRLVVQEQVGGDVGADGTGEDEVAADCAAVDQHVRRADRVRCLRRTDKAVQCHDRSPSMGRAFLLSE